MRTTIKDIAHETGLSVTTVSLVLNGKGDRISEATRSKVLLTAARLHYRPNQLAVSLVKRHTKTLGMVLPDITNGFFSYLVRAVEEEASRQGYHMILCHSGDQRERDSECINMLLDKQVDGILYISAVNSTAQDMEEALHPAAANGVPVVLIDRVSSIPGVSTVSLDNEQGAYLAINHLTALGHRRIGLLTASLLSAVTQARLSGARAALAKAGISPEHSPVFEGTHEFESGLPATEFFLNHGVTAVFAFSDVLALSVLHRALELDCRIPDKLSVAGFDDLVLARVAHIPLTTIRQPITEMGVCAARLLIERMRGGSFGDENRVFSPQLIVRESTGPAPR